MKELSSCARQAEVAEFHSRQIPRSRLNVWALEYDADFLEELLALTNEPWSSDVVRRLDIVSEGIADFANRLRACEGTTRHWSVRTCPLRLHGARAFPLRSAF